MSAGDTDVMLVKYSTAGDLVWARRAGGATADEGTRRLRSTARGTSTSPGHSPGRQRSTPTPWSASGDFDAFVAKYDRDGSVLWVRSGGGGDEDAGFGIAADASGYCTVTGRVEGSAVFESDTLTGSGLDLFVTRYDPDGNLVWALRGDAANFSLGLAVAMGPGGNAFLCGNSSGTFSLGDSTLTENGTLVAKLATDGTVEWMRQGVGSFDPSDIASDGGGACYLTGRHRGIDFGDIAFTQSTLYFEGYLVKWDTDGTFQWGREMGALNGVTEVKGHSLAIDPFDRVFVGMHFHGNVDLGDTSFTVNNFTAMTVEYDTSGAYQDLLIAGTGMEFWRLPIATDNFGNLFRVTFDDSVVVANRSALFLSKHGANPPSAASTPVARARLGASYPNPFNPATVIPFFLPESGPVELTVYDVTGARVRTLVAGDLPRGEHTARWDGRDERGNLVASGVYLYRLATASASLSRKMVLLK